MKRISTFLLGILISSFTLTHTYSQQLIRCYTDEQLASKIQDDPAYEQRIQNARDIADQYLQHHSGQRAGNVITIPVAFHIIHNGEPIGTPPNISDAQVISQLQVLSEDFRRLNSDTANTPAAFKPVAGDALIEFQLAKIDPDGNPTTGIVRHNMLQAQWSSTNDIDNIVKPQTIWDNLMYFNMWSINMSNNILGYATFPGGSSDEDGIVLDYRFVGRSPINPNPPPYNQGRTATHEVGHYLGLRHIWGDGPCGTDDNINDTPLSDDSNYGCAVSHISCGTPDMVQNYMDYSNDGCMNLFTQGQVDAMLATMSTIRVGLTTSPVLFQTFNYTGQVIDQATGQGVANAKVLFQSGNSDYEVEVTTDAGGFFNSSSFIEETYTVYAGKWGYETKLAFPNQLIDAGTGPMTIAIEKGSYYDDFILDFDWNVSSTANSGIWERDVPVEGLFNSDISNPGIDGANDFGNKCYVTGNGGGAAGSDDVDDGRTTLTSPMFDVTDMDVPTLRYERWFFNGGGNGDPLDDALVVFLSNGSTTIGIESITTFNENNTNQWKSRTFKISDIMQPTATMRFIIETADDAATGHIVDAGLDKFEVFDAGFVGIEQVNGFSELLVYPNPTRNILNISYELMPGNSELQIDIIDTKGQVVYQSTAHHMLKDQLSVDLSNHAGGIYFVRFNNGIETLTKRVTLLN